MNDSLPAVDSAASVTPYSRKNPFLAELIRHDRLTLPGSSKDTRHFVLNLAGSGLSYTPGDSLGAFGRNSPGLVDDLIAWLEFDPQTQVTNARGESTTLRLALLQDYTVNRANRKVMSGLAQRLPTGAQSDRLSALLADSEQLSEYIGTRDYVDILKDFDEAAFETAADFLSQLTPVVPRLYSIASSPLAHPGEVHLCIAVVRYDTHGRAKKGLASGFLADHADMFVKNIPVYVQETRAFRLPQDPSTDIIMIGPGAGVAPFRAFLEHRVAQGATGRNWLFFGEQCRATDFLYQDEFLAYQGRGSLHRLDLAFSRDQPDKIYVQHRLREQGREVWSWLQNGAYLYVCGDARHMAKDVHQTLIEIAQTVGGLSAEVASEYVNGTLMKAEKRYLRDIY